MPYICTVILYSDSFVCFRCTDWRWIDCQARNSFEYGDFSGHGKCRHLRSHGIENGGHWHQGTVWNSCSKRVSRFCISNVYTENIRESKRCEAHTWNRRLTLFNLWTRQKVRYKQSGWPKMAKTASPTLLSSFSHHRAIVPNFLARP